MIAKEKIRNIIEEKLTDSGLFLVDLKVSARNKIIVLLDGDKGVPISSCVEVSRFIESQLDREVEDFELEVSSVGVDSPLAMVRQFVKNIGRDIAFNNPEGKKVKGKLLAADAAGFTLEKELPSGKKKNKTQEIEDPVQKFTYEQASDVKVQVSFKKPEK